jgi:gliding motility-associated-like protein
VSNVTVNTTPTITVNSGVICTGQSFTMTPAGATTYTYSSGTNVVSPLVNTTYTVTGTSALGCVASNTVISSVTVNITPTITVNSGVICTGQSFTMTPGGASTYTYSSGSNVVNPLVNTSYSVTGTSALGCIGSNTAVSIVTVNITPTITVNSGVICTGQSFTMTPAGASTYTYSSGSNVVSPLSNTSYSVTGTSALGCIGTNTAVSSVTVNTTPTITVNSGIMCTGFSFTMVPSGASTYTYSSGSSIVTPTANTTYTVTGTSALGCVGSNTAVSSVTVNATPTITVYSGVICAGSPYTITPTGASTYTYSSGSAVVSPTTTTSYSITGTSALGCVGSNTAICTLIALPLPMITVNSGAICSGDSFTMVPSGATTYTFSSGTAVVSPTTSTTYTVTGTDSDGCTNSVGAISSVTVYALPSLTVSASSTSVCSGNSSTLTVSGASSYTWNTGPTVASISVTPSITTTYTVTGTDALGCVNTSTQTVVLFANPTINLSSSNASVCVGFNSVLTASGVNTYTWSTGVNTPSISVSPTVSTTYSVNGTDINGCVATNTTISVGINPNPTVTAVASNTGVCLGALADLTASGASSYVWSTGSLTSTTTVSPLVNTTYTVTGTNSFGCSSDAVITITAYATPTLTIGPDIEVAIGSSYEFNPTQSGASTYSWTPSDYLNSTTIINATTTPLNDIMYILTATSINGCTVSDTVFVKVLANLIIANYMSPNGDGVNDTWKLNVPLLIKNYSVDIIDSYNQKVYHKDDNYNNEFDGTFNGQNLPDGVYYYFIKDNSTLIYKGSITLTR